MQCMYCGCTKSKVINTTKAEKKILRERKCQSCGKYFWTKETSTPEEQCFIRRELYMIREMRKGAKQCEK